MVASFDIGLGAIGLSNGIAMDFPPTFSDGSFSCHIIRIASA